MLTALGDASRTILEPVSELEGRTLLSNGKDVRILYSDIEGDSTINIGRPGMIGYSQSMANCWGIDKYRYSKYFKVLKEEELVAEITKKRNVSIFAIRESLYSTVESYSILNGNIGLRSIISGQYPEEEYGLRGLESTIVIDRHADLVDPLYLMAINKDEYDFFIANGKRAFLLSLDEDERITMHEQPNYSKKSKSQAYFGQVYTGEIINIIKNDPNRPIFEIQDDFKGSIYKEKSINGTASITDVLQSERYGLSYVNTSDNKNNFVKQIAI